MNIKIWAYLGIVIAVLAGIKAGYSAIYRAGFNAAVVEQEKLIQDAREQASEEARVKWQALVDEAEGQIKVEEKIVEVIREVERKIPIVVDRIVEVDPGCADLGPDFVGVLNDQVGAGRGGEADSPGVPAVTD